MARLLKEFQQLAEFKFKNLGIEIEKRKLLKQVICSIVSFFVGLRNF